jgi:steroid delta-isomerase-like uncharacterized protein
MEIIWRDRPSYVDRMVNRRFLLGASLVSIAAGGASATNDTISHNRRLIRRYFEEVWNAGRLETLDEILAPDYVNHTPSVPNPARGPAGLKPIVTAIRAAFPDLHYSIEDIIATNSAVVARVIMTGTHRADLFGLRPTGKAVRIDQINIEHIVDGRIVEHWRVTDELTLMRQLGAVR